jgi:hypothetical protein
MRKLAAVGAVVIVAALAVWYFALRDRDAKPTTPVASATGSAARPAKAADRPGRSGDVEMAPRVLVDDDPKGELRLEGQVVDEADAGIGGVTVIISSNPPRIATSEADGSFAFDALVARPYTLVARGTGKVAGPVTAQLTASSDPVILKLRVAPKLTVAVVGPDGKPIDGATLPMDPDRRQRCRSEGHARRRCSRPRPRRR